MADQQVKYNIVFPLSKKDNYVAQDTVDFLISLENKKLVPGSIAICGQLILGTDVTTDPSVVVKAISLLGEELLIDPEAGAHCFFRNFVTEFRNVGLTESFQNYPRYVKMKSQATRNKLSLGTETGNSIELKTASQTVSKGLLYGKADGLVPFVIRPDIAANKSSAPIPGNQVGVIRIRVQLAANNECVYGKAAGADSGYVLRNLELRYETVADDGTRPPLAMEVYNCARQTIETNNANLATFVPGMADSVHMSFIPVSDEALTNSDRKNFLRCAPIPGIPLTVVSATGTDRHIPRYGAERVYYAVNDTDTALVGFTMESREEMLWNYLRSFNNEPKSSCVMESQLQAPLADGYGLGINFGTLLDFSQQKFACEIDSATAEPYAVYLYFRGRVQL